MMKSFVLSNGIKVVMYQMSQIKSVQINLSIKGGSLVEKKEVGGVAHFMEHMLVQGIPLFPTAEKLSTFIEGLAGRYNAFTDQLSVSFFIKVPFIHLEDAITIASQVFFQPLFPEDAIEKERKAILTEIIQDRDGLGYKLNKEFKHSRFVENSILLQDVGGQEATINAITKKDILEYWQTYFTPENTYMYIGGNFEQEKITSLLQKHFETKPKTHAFPGFPTLTSKEYMPGGILIRENKELGTNYLTLSLPSLTLDDDWKLLVLQDIALTTLAQLRTSRLFMLLRYQKGLVYNISAQRALIPGIGYIYINSEVANEHVEEVIQEIGNVLYEFIQNGPTQEELDFVKNYYINSWLMAFDNPSSASEWLEGELMWEEKVKMPEDYIEMVKTATTQQVIDVVKKYWDLSKMQLLIQGPLENTNEAKEKFSKLLHMR